MALIKLSNKSFLREHPFLNPVSVPFPVQSRSYIFPGDEIVMYHKITLPTDVSVTSINDIKFVSAKCSIIAQKPNVFSEEFSNQFLSTRIFELDSYTTAFNNTNARIIPWGSPLGADGYATNLTIKEDRNWQLPSGDFKREINFFTKHTNGASTWDYWFYFPVLFRWEYWMQLMTADNYFYNNTQPNDGLNHFWNHYFVNGVWNLKSRLDLNVLINGIPQLVRAELNLTPLADSINDYSSNTDYTQKNIKTSKIGGTLTNAPCFIYGKEFTVVVGDFRKVTPWTEDTEKVKGLNWIEPFEGAGVTVRTRGSSFYNATPESVFIGLGTSATDDDGIGIQDGSGNYIVLLAGGKGAITIFDAATPEQVKVVSVIDNNKLNSIYTGSTKFTLYSRLYNSITVSGETSKGEELKQDASYLLEQNTSNVCTMKKPDCPFALKVYADETDTDDLKNDKSAFYYFGNATVASMVLTLQKNNVNCGDAYTDVITITNNAVGKFFSFGTNPDFSGTAFIDDYDKKYTGVFIDWRKVLLAYGTGNYRMKIVKTDVFGTVTTEYDQRQYCLYKYNCRLMDGSVRIEILNEGLRGIIGQDNFIDYAGGWNDQIRLNGVFMKKGSSYTKEFNQYGDSSFNALKPITNEQTPKYTLAIKPIPGWMDYILSTDVLQADEIKITDYNLRNRHTLVKVPVINEGEYTPRDNNMGSVVADVVIEMSYGRNNLRKRNSQ